MRKLVCPKCGHEWKMNYWKWVFTAPFHCVSFRTWRDTRKTKCPGCKQKSWITSEKIEK